MNKILTILFTIYFTTISSGVIFGKHYCGDSVSRDVWGVSIDSSDSKCCCSHDSIEHSEDCCKSETIVLKSESDKFNPSAQFKLFKPFELELFFTYSLNFIFNENRESNDVSIIIHPPPEPSSPLYILHKILLI